MPGEARGKGRERGLDRGRATDMWKQKRHIYVQTNGLAQTQTQLRTESRLMHANTQTQIFPSTRCISLAFLPLPLAVSQIPDDVLTGGLSDWR
ncbi:hypothetical protein PBY51_010720 [Eleginops maclovinus]|uniref:Uncharacterized protein n=1 Tax=Eleginops maclovinus TaxID=56733 RepID=A0AAN8AIL6_ELEMC|nr:hypothetical protein PBY51_010720 [Eleginops maclovinus]